MHANPRTLRNHNTKTFLPRVGLAYSLTPLTVIRAGFGIYFEPNGVPNFDVIQTGFTQTTQQVPTVDTGQHFLGTLVNPFPNGLLPSVGAGAGLSTQLGRSVSFVIPNLRARHMALLQFAAQSSFAGGALAEAYCSRSGLVRGRLPGTRPGRCGRGRSC